MNEQDQRVRDYYENLSMPQDRLDSLLNPENVSAQRSTSALRMGSLKRRLASIFSVSNMHWGTWLRVGLACGLLLMVSLWMHNTGLESERMQRTIREVAMNHTTRLEPEYRGESLAMLDNSMQQLPFALVLPKAIDDAYELIGSRYCSLGGLLAAHVRLKDSTSGKPMSLFVTSNSTELEEIRSQQTTLEGVDVELWREGGLFFALAQRS